MTSGEAVKMVIHTLERYHDVRNVEGILSPFYHLDLGNPDIFGNPIAGKIPFEQIEQETLRRAGQSSVTVVEGRRRSSSYFGRAGLQ